MTATITEIEVIEDERLDADVECEWTVCSRPAVLRIIFKAVYPCGCSGRRSVVSCQECWDAYKNRPMYECFNCGMQLILTDFFEEARSLK